MKHRFTFKITLLALLIGIGLSAKSQTLDTAAFFLQFSDAAENARSVNFKTDVMTFENGRMQFADSGDDNGIRYSISDAANVIELDNSQDSLFAVKFIGDIPLADEATMAASLQVYIAFPSGSNVDHKNGISNLRFYKTPAGNNTVAYFNMHTQTSTGSGANLLSQGVGVVTADWLQFKLRSGGAFNTEVDWLGFFSSVANIENTAKAQDDGAEDEDEVTGNDANLSNIDLDGSSIPGFTPGQLTYHIVFEEGTTAVPTIAGTLSDAEATITSTTQAATLQDTASIVVTSGNAAITQTYKISFSVHSQSPQLFISMNDTVQNKNVNVDNNVYEIANGSLTTSSYAEGETFRQDFQFGFPDGSADSYRMNPLKDVYMAAKFNGGLYDGFVLTDGSPFDPFFSIKGTAVSGSSLVVSTLSGNDVDVKLYTTPAGNDVIYFRLDSLNNQQWNDLVDSATVAVAGGGLESSFEVYADQLEFKFRPAPVAFEWDIDWVGFFTTEADIQAMALAMDDGENDWHDFTPNTLSAATYNDVSIEGFDPEVVSYNIELPLGTTAVPTVTATASKDGATVVVNAATSLPGNTTIDVTGIDATGQATAVNTYTINFTVAQALSTDATLSNLPLDGSTVTGFDPATLTYDITLPFGTTAVPAVTATANFSEATAEVTAAASLPGSTTVLVTAQDGSTQTYTININVTPGKTDATLATLKVNNVALAGFDASVTSYDYEVEFAGFIPIVAFTVSDADATAVITDATAIPGSTTIVVTAQDGTTTTTYTINFTLKPLSVDVTEAAFNIYPNPATSIVNISGITEGTHLEAQISDLSGVVLRKAIVNGAIDVSDLKAGVYFISIADFKTMRLIKQ